MSLEFDWTFDLNVAPVGANNTEKAKYFLLKLFTFLTDNGWSYDGSSNSVAVHAVNNVTSVANIVINYDYNPHTWVVLKSPEGLIAGPNGTYTGDQSRLWIIFNCMSPYGATSPNVQTIYCTTKPTGGTTSAVPTAPKSLVTNGNVSYEQYSILTSSNIHSATRYHYGITSKGHFYACVTGFYTDSYRMPFMLALFPLTDLVKISGKDYPYNVAMFQQFVITPGNATYIPNEGLLKYFNYDGTNPSTFYSVYPIVGSNPYGLQASQQLSFKGELPVFRLGIQPPGGYGIIGTIADFLFVGANGVPASTMNFAGDLCLFGRWFIPVDTMIRS